MEAKEAGDIFANVPVAVPYPAVTGQVPPQAWRDGVNDCTAAYKNLLECEWMDNLGFTNEPTGEKVVDLSKYNVIREESTEPIHRISVRMPQNKFIKIFEGPKSEADRMIAILKVHIEARI